MAKKSYLGGSTIVKRSSSWFGKGEFSPDSWGGETDEERWLRGPKRATLPELRDRDELLKKHKSRRCAKKARRKSKPKKSKEERLEEKYKTFSDILFKK